MKLYTYWRSSSAYRVRIALNLKGLDYEPHFVHLVRGGGEQHSPEYCRLNPQELVPTLLVEGRALTQSMAIVEFLEEHYPDPPLLPTGPFARARVRALASLIACEMQPLNNVSVLGYLRHELERGEDAVRGWYKRWIKRGFDALEKLLESPETGQFSHGDTPTMADVFLVPQYYNAVRYDCDLDPYPTIQRICHACNEIEAFRAAAPENQGDAE